MKKRTREGLTFELTPLIDVVFLLLIFFMVTTVFKKDQSILDLNLPKTDLSGGGVQKKEKRLNVELSETDLAVNGKKYAIEEFEGFLGTLKDSKVPVDLKVDKKVAYERLVKVLELLQKKNFSNLSLITNN
ncbi:MAG: ExbD/TolR family protein [Bacteriovoracaceae bacterium]